MPFKVTDKLTGKIATFENQPTDEDIQEVFGTAQDNEQLPLTPSHIPSKEPAQLKPDIATQTLEGIKTGLGTAQGSVQEMVGNIPSSFAKLVKDTVTPFLHPIDTGKGLLNLATLDNKTWGSIVDFYKNRYGGAENLKQTMLKDPAGFAADISTILSGAGAVTKGVGKGVMKLAHKETPPSLPGVIPKKALPPGQGFTMEGKPYYKPPETPPSLPGVSERKLLTVDWAKKIYTPEEINIITKGELPNIPFINEKIKTALGTQPFARTAEQKALLRSLGEQGYITIPSIQSIGAKLQGAGKMLSETGQVTDPFRAMGKTISLGGKAASDIASTIFGMSTSQGKQAFKQAFKGGKEFTKGIRKKILAEDVLDNALSALNEVKFERSQAYKSKLAEITKQSQGLQINKAPIVNEVRRILKGSGATLERNLDTGRLEVVNLKQSIVKTNPGFQELLEDIVNHQDWSPLGADELRKIVDSYYSPNKYVGAVVTKTRNVLNKEIVNKVPAYHDMIKDYAKISDDINEIQKNLLNGKTDTALRRLQTSFREVNDYRLKMVDRLDELTNGKLKEQLAGVALQSALPRGWPSKMIPAMAAGGAGLYTGNPLVTAGMLAMESPRLTGELALKAGQIGRGAETVGGALMPWWKYLYQTGRLQNNNLLGGQ